MGPPVWNISLIHVDTSFLRTMEMVSNFPMFSFCMFVNRDGCAALMIRMPSCGYHFWVPFVDHFGIHFSNYFVKAILHMANLSDISTTRAMTMYMKLPTWASFLSVLGAWRAPP